MSFALFILGNLMRQKIRTGLTVLGISIGVTAVVALGVFLSSANAANLELLRAGGADFIVAREGSAAILLGTLTEDDVAAIRAYPDVDCVSSPLVELSDEGTAFYTFEFGFEPASLDTCFNLPIKEGRLLSPNATNEILLGRSSGIRGKVGDVIQLHDRDFNVVGIFDSDASQINGGAILPISTLRDIKDKPNLSSIMFVKVKPGTDVEGLKAQIEADHPSLAAVENLSETGDIDQLAGITNALDLAVMAVAVFIGAIAVMNTMVMAVFERTREFGILRALGWRTRRIIQMVMGESLLLCLIASVAGSLIAVALTQIVVAFPAIGPLIHLKYTVGVFVRGLIVGVSAGLLGALYPAYRAARLSPAQAIRYE